MPGSTANEGFNINDMFSIINDATREVKTKMSALKSQGSAISIADMFDMQMSMNRLSQMSESMTSVLSATNSAIASMARNVKS